MKPFSPEELKQKFSSPKQEIDYLRDRLRKIESTVRDENTAHELMHDDIQSYVKYKPEEVLEPKAIMTEVQQNDVILNLTPEEHDEKISDLLVLIQQRGVINVINLVAKLEDPHISDDLHRFLVQYLRAGYELKGLDYKEPISRTLKRTLFEVIPRDAQKKDNTQGKTFKENIASMEQFYLGLISVISNSFKDEYITVEIANPIERQDFIFFISVPESKADLFEKQIHAFFPDANIIEYTDDFNVFYEKGGKVGAYGVQEKVPPRMLKTLEDFEDDPIKAVLNVFSKLDETTLSKALVAPERNFETPTVNLVAVLFFINIS